jgi:alpha-tubulin suppressor-like RCC1 family protein
MKTLLKFSLFILLLHTLAASAAVTVTNIAQGCTASHSLFLKSDGSLWAMGYNYYSQLGDGKFNNTYRPEEIVAGGVTAIAVGGYHSLFLKSDGSLWTMGSNLYGELGDGTWNWEVVQPEEIVADGVTAIAAGDLHSLFLKSDGSLWAMGGNVSGQLGDGSYYFGTNQPEEILASDVTAIAAGEGHSLFLKSDGSLWAMGWNQDGQLGDGTYATTWPYSTNQPQEIVAGGVIAIAAGQYHSLFLKSDGSLWAMGANGYGQLGDGTFNNTNQPEEIVASNVVALAAGGQHSLFLKSDGSLWAMGINSSGQLGNGTVYETNQPEEIVMGGVTAIAAGQYHSLFLKSDGSLWGMGDDSFGELGDGFYDVPIGETTVPEQIYPPPQPVLAQTVSNTDLQFTAICGFGGNFCLLTSTNIFQPLEDWTPVWTNTISYRWYNVFSATLTNAVYSGNQQFYILQSQ